MMERIQLGKMAGGRREMDCTPQRCHTFLNQLTLMFIQLYLIQMIYILRIFSQLQ